MVKLRKDLADIKIEKMREEVNERKVREADEIINNALEKFKKTARK